MANKQKMVLLPGMDGTGMLFQPFINALGASVSPLVISYPIGEWLSYKKLESLVWRTLPKDVSYVLLAESFSGPLAISIASRKPPGLKGVILCASFAKHPAPAFLKWFAQSLVFQFGMRRSLLRGFLMNSGPSSFPMLRFVEAIQAVSPKVLANRLKDVLTVDVTDSLRTFEIPIVYVVGTRDRLIGDRGFKQIRVVRPETIKISIDGPHLLLQCRPYEVAQAIQPFLRLWLAG